VLGHGRAQIGASRAELPRNSVGRRISPAAPFSCQLNLAHL